MARFSKTKDSEKETIYHAELGRLQVTLSTWGPAWKINREFAFTLNNRSYCGFWFGGLRVSFDKK